MSDWAKVAGDDGKAFADWVGGLRGKSGVYAIRWNGGWLSDPGVVYVGESHTGRLYETFSRHFQRWDGPQGRTSWPRGECEAFALVLDTDAGGILEKQARLIADLEPSQNRYDLPDESAGEGVPF